MFIRNGYSKEDIEEMETDEYDFIKHLILEMSSKGKLNTFGGL